MRPTFGCGLRRYLGEPNTVAVRALIRHDVELALARVGAADRRRGRRGRPRRRPGARRDRDLVRPRADEPSGQPRLPLLPRLTMPLPQPILDDRSYQQLRDELVRRIPVYAPEWTDYNASDPGVTLIELFAFLGENLLFRFNQIPESTKLQFLRLLDVPLRPASVAEGLRRVHDPDARRRPRRAADDGAGRQRAVRDDGRGRRAGRVSARAVGRLSRGAPKPGEEEAFATRAWDAYRRIDTCAARPRRPSTTRPQVLGDDPTAPGAARSTSRPRSTERCGSPSSARRRRQAVARRRDPQRRRRPRRGRARDGGRRPLSRHEGPARRTSVVWQVVDRRRRRREAALPRPQPRRRHDERAHPARRRPASSSPHDLTTVGLFEPDDPDAAGTGDLPPEIDAELEEKLALLAARVPGRRLEARPPALGRRERRRDRAGAGGERRSSSAPGRATPPQTAALVHTPVLPGTLALEVEDASGWTPWQEVDDFDASREDDRHYVLDPEAGTVTFGNGVRGAAPQIGQRIRVTGYRYGGGLAGNVPAEGA